MTPKRALSAPIIHSSSAVPTPSSLRLVPASPAAPPTVIAPIAVTRGASPLFLASEFLLSFIGIPLALFFRLATKLPPLPVLWLVSVYCLVVLLRDPTFDRRQLWNPAPLRQQLPQVLALFAAGVIVVSALVHQYAPSLFLILLRTHPRMWAFIMVGYPLFSVYPQGLIYRAFLFHRYRPLLQSCDPLVRSWIMILVSAATFALMHILFHNWIAVAMTFPGGIIFALRYCNTRSLCVSSIEHALYGCFLFTIGLGQFFYIKVV
jgi:membrane protease YdiL (CAAX protease family)